LKLAEKCVLDHSAHLQEDLEMDLSLHQGGLWKGLRNQEAHAMDLSLHQGGLWKGSRNLGGLEMDLRNSEGFETEGFQEQAN
jgi:hypothetical protein